MQNIANKGYVHLYHKGKENHCPACTGTQWIVGRVTAECAQCDAVLQLADVENRPTKTVFWKRMSKTAERRREHMLGYAA